MHPIAIVCIVWAQHYQRVSQAQLRMNHLLVLLGNKVLSKTECFLQPNYSCGGIALTGSTRAVER